jgi:hypothetical protein
VTATLPPQGPTPRETLAAAVLAAQPEWTVREYPWRPKQVAPGQAAVAVWRSDLEAASPLALRHVLTVNLYCSKTDGAAAEAEADDALDQLLLVIQATPGLEWSRAERHVFDNTFTGWQITASGVSTNVYRQAVLAGGA